MAEKNKKIAPVKSKKLKRGITSPLKRIATRLGLVSPKIQTWVYLIILSGTISLLLFPNTLMLSKEDYSLGDVARKDLNAPRDFPGEDTELTQPRKPKAIDPSLFVYVIYRPAAHTSTRVNKSFTSGSEGV